MKQMQQISISGAKILHIPHTHTFTDTMTHNYVYQISNCRVNAKPHMYSELTAQNVLFCSYPHVLNSSVLR